jgi:hypothetical protein
MASMLSKRMELAGFGTLAGYKTKNAKNTNTGSNLLAGLKKDQNLIKPMESETAKAPLMTDKSSEIDMDEFTEKTKPES